jgi:hypothetical protein
VADDPRQVGMGRGDVPRRNANRRPLQKCADSDEVQTETCAGNEVGEFLADAKGVTFVVSPVTLSA